MRRADDDAIVDVPTYPGDRVGCKVSDLHGAPPHFFTFHTGSAVPGPKREVCMRRQLIVMSLVVVLASCGDGGTAPDPEVVSFNTMLVGNWVVDIDGTPFRLSVTGLTPNLSGAFSYGSFWGTFSYNDGFVAGAAVSLPLAGVSACAIGELLFLGTVSATAMPGVLTGSLQTRVGCTPTTVKSFPDLAVTFQKEV